MSRTGWHGDLQIQEDLPFQRLQWRIERAGWVAMGLVLALALGGLFGDGWLAQARAGDPAGSLWVEYERFARLSARGELRVHVRPRPGQDVVAVWLGSGLLDRVDLDSVTPPPAATETGPAGVRYTFHAAEPGRPVVARFTVRAHRWGAWRAAVWLDTQAPVELSQWVYP